MRKETATAYLIRVLITLLVLIPIRLITCGLAYLMNPPLSLAAQRRKAWHNYYAAQQQEIYTAQQHRNYQNYMAWVTNQYGAHTHSKACCVGNSQRPMAPVPISM